MDTYTFDQRLAEMQVHERRMAASLKQALAGKRVAEDHVETLKSLVAAQRSRAEVTVTSEPLTYRRGGPFSFFYDVARYRQMGNSGVQDRLARHRREMDVELPKRAEMRARAAQAAYEAAFYSTPGDRRAMDAMLAGGGSPFERRGISRTDSQGGFFAPPIWLVDRYVQFAREGSPFASRWQVIDLPPGTSEINVPRLAVATGTGPQSDTAQVVTQDIQDQLVTATVSTVAGHADASRQWLEQGQGQGGFGVDEMLFADLTADLAQNIDGQALLGSGNGQQLLGVWPAGAIATANGIIVADTSASVWTTAIGSPSLQTSLAQLVSLGRRIRNRPDGWEWYWHPWAWSLYASQVDASQRPLLTDQCDLPPGVAGYYQNIPVRLDANIPTTFGGTIAPYMAAITAGQYAAQPGTGGSYTPMLLARPDDLFMFPGDVRLQTLSEVLSGSAQVRFQAFQYLAAMPNRYVAAAAVGSSVSAGGDVAHATFTSQHSGSLLILSGSGY